MKSVCTALLSVVIVSVVSADTVTLIDGSRLSGSIKRDGTDWVVTSPEGVARRVAASAVKSVELTGRALSADEKLAGLRHAVEALTDLDQIVSRYQQFIDQNPRTPAAQQAANELAVYRDYQAKGMVKSGGQWVTIAQQRTMAVQANILAGQARQLVKDGRSDEAEALLDKALAVDADNASALYLKGYLQFESGQYPAARKSFESVLAAVPNHVATLNNLAVTLFQQKQYGGAMKYYDQAMQAQAGNQYILSNVAEALNALPDDAARASIPARSAQKHYEQQQAALQASLARQGLRQWGASYVTEEQFQQIQAAQAQIKSNVDQLQGDYTATQNRIQQIDATVAANDQTMRTMEMQSRYIDNQGNIFNVGLPAAYYTLQAEQQRLGVARGQLAQHLDALRQSAKLAQQQTPFPKFTGIQRLVGPEGTPLVIPTSQPAQ